MVQGVLWGALNWAHMIGGCIWVRPIVRGKLFSEEQFFTPRIVLSESWSTWGNFWQKNFVKPLTHLHPPKMTQFQRYVLPIVTSSSYQNILVNWRRYKLLVWTCQNFGTKYVLKCLYLSIYIYIYICKYIYR